MYPQFIFYFQSISPEVKRNWSHSWFSIIFDREWLIINLINLYTNHSIIYILLIYTKDIIVWIIIFAHQKDYFILVDCANIIIRDLVQTLMVNVLQDVVMAPHVKFVAFPAISLAGFHFVYHTMYAATVSAIMTKWSVYQALQIIESFWLKLSLNER